MTLAFATTLQYFFCTCHGVETFANFVTGLELMFFKKGQENLILKEILSSLE